METSAATFNQFIRRYRQFLADAQGRAPEDISVFNDAPKMQLTPVQREVWRRVQNSERPEYVMPNHCDVCAEEWREDLQVAVRQIDAYLAGVLGDDIVRCIVAVYRLLEEGVSVAIYSDNKRVWVRGGAGLGEKAQEYLNEHSATAGIVLSNAVVPQCLGEFALESVSGIQTLFINEV